MAEITFALGLVARHTDVGSIHHDNEVTCVNVGGEFRLVFAAKAMRDGSGQSAEHFVGGIYYKPVALNLMRLG